MVTLTSSNPDETRRLGEEWGRSATPGWVIGLSGELGAGKTQLVKGLAAGLGSVARVHSPTFALIHEYTGGRLPLFHLDLYRLENHDQVRAAGLEEYLVEPQGVAVVEWYERWEAGAPSPVRLRRVWMEVVSEQVRHIRYEDTGT